MSSPELIEGVHYYTNENGYVVFTGLYLLERGYCCGMGCLNCPYDHENVPEVKITKTVKPGDENPDNNV